jgi:DNA-binding response OmpR family regulator
MRRRAVIFEDDALIRFALWRLFDDRGYEIFTFPEPGLCPLNVVRECPCPADTSCSDLVISDVNMSGTNGIDFLEGLIQKGCRQRHFALMSGNFSEDDMARASQLGCALFGKPLAMARLTAWIEEAEQSIPPERKLFDWNYIPSD